MSKAILEFTLPEELAEHRAAMDGARWKALAWYVDQDLFRHEIKYADHPEPVQELLERLRSDFHDRLAAYSLSLND